MANPWRWSWLLADLHPEDGVEDIVGFLREWEGAEHGLIPKEERSAWLVSHAVGRLPPLLSVIPDAETREG